MQKTPESEFKGLKCWVTISEWDPVSYTLPTQVFGRTWLLRFLGLFFPSRRDKNYFLVLWQWGNPFWTSRCWIAKLLGHIWCLKKKRPITNLKPLFLEGSRFSVTAWRKLPYFWSKLRNQSKSITLVILWSLYFY